jgi:hypothetical protein
MIRKSGHRFSEEISSNNKIERVGDSKNSYPALTGPNLILAAAFAVVAMHNGSLAGLPCRRK